MYRMYHGEAGVWPLPRVQSFCIMAGGWKVSGSERDAETSMTRREGAKFTIIHGELALITRKLTDCGLFSG